MKAPHVNRIIRTLILSDLALFFGLGLLSPIFAVFVLEHVDSNLEVVGVSLSVYWIVRVLLVIPFSRLMDALPGDKDEFAFMILGTFLISCVPLGYLVASEPWHIYVLQACYGAASAMAVPAWRVLFTHNIDAGEVGYEWSLEDVGIGVATASSALIGTMVAQRWGFDALFVAIFGFGSLATLLLLSIAHRAEPSVWAFLRHPRRRRTDVAPLKVGEIK